MLFNELITSIHVKRAAENDYRCKCPAHQGQSNTSLSISEGENGALLLHCFAGCAYSDIAAALGVKPALSGRKTVAGGQLAPRPRPAHQPPSSDWQRAACAAVEAAHEFLLSDNPAAAAALGWLTQRRGLTLETIRAARLGYNPSWAKVAGNSLAPGVTIPCYAAGALQYVKVRLGKAARQGDKLPKYINLKGGGRALFGADNLPAPNVIICEGEFDALLMGQFLPDGWAAVTMGSASSVADVATWKKYFVLTSGGYIAMDNDQAGDSGLGKWGKILPWLDVLALPDGCGDLTDYWQSGGDLRGLITPEPEPEPEPEAARPVQPGPLPKLTTRQPEPARPAALILPTSGVKRAVLANHILIKERRGLPLSAGLLATKQALVEVGALCQR